MNLSNAQRRTLVSVLVLFGSIASAACTSSSGGKSTGTAGTSGSGGTSGGGAGGSTAGTSGSAGTSGTGGTSGTAGSDGGAAGAAPDGSAPEVNACGIVPNLGTATLVMQSAQEGGDRSTATVHNAVAWLGYLDNNTQPDVLDVQLYKNAAPFGAMLQSMSISLTGQSDFKTCGACVFYHPMYSNGVELRAQKDYIATGGTLNITAVPNISGPDGGADAGGAADGGAALRLTASLTNVTFEHVMIDDLFATTKVDDCTASLTSASIDSPVPVSPFP